MLKLRLILLKLRLILWLLLRLLKLRLLLWLLIIRPRWYCRVFV